MPGRFGKAIELDGRNQTVRISHHARLKPADTVTISAWIKPTETSDRWREIYRKEDGDAPIDEFARPADTAIPRT